MPNWCGVRKVAYRVTVSQVNVNRQDDGSPYGWAVVGIWEKVGDNEQQKRRVRRSSKAIDPIPE